MRLRFLECMAGVSRVFFVAAIVSDSANDIFGIVTTGQSAFCEGPVEFGLALMISGQGAFMIRVKVSWGFRRIVVNREGAGCRNRVALVLCSNDEFFGRLSICESRQAEYARGVRCR